MRNLLFLFIVYSLIVHNRWALFDYFLWSFLIDHDWLHFWILFATFFWKFGSRKHIELHAVISSVIVIANRFKLQYSVFVAIEELVTFIFEVLIAAVGLKWQQIWDIVIIQKFDKTYFGVNGICHEYDVLSNRYSQLWQHFNCGLVLLILFLYSFEGYYSSSLSIHYGNLLSAFFLAIWLSCTITCSDFLSIHSENSWLFCPRKYWWFFEIVLHILDINCSATKICAVEILNDIRWCNFENNPNCFSRYHVFCWWHARY